MCYDLYLVHPRCGHVKSPLPQSIYCDFFARTGRICHSKRGAVAGSLTRFSWILSTHADNDFVCELENAVDTRLAFLARKYPGFCRSCSNHETEPLKEHQRQEFLFQYLSSYDDELKWVEDERKWLVEQEREFGRAAQTKCSETGLKGGKEEEHPHSRVLKWQADQGSKDEGGIIDDVEPEICFDGQVDDAEDHVAGSSDQSQHGD